MQSGNQSASSEVQLHAASALAHAGRVDGVSFQDVKKAVEKLTAEGKAVTLRSVHSEVGRGSRSTIHKHVKAIRGAQVPLEPADPPAVPAHIVRALASEIERVAKERASVISLELEDAQASLDLVVNESEVLRSALAESDSLLASARSSLAEQSGTVAAQQFRIEALTTQLEAVTSEAEADRQALAILKEQVRASTERFSQLQGEHSLTKEEAAEIRLELQRTREGAEARMRECIRLEAKLEATAARETLLKQSAEKAQVLQADLGEARNRLSALEAERRGRAELLEETKQALARAEATIQMLLPKLLDITRPSAAGEDTQNDVTR